MTVTALLGIDNVTKVFDELIECGNVAGEIAALPKDLKWYQKITPIAKILDESVALFTVEWKMLLPELKDLSGEEKATLTNHFVAKFDIPQDRAEALVERCFAVLLVIINATIELIDIAMEAKTPVAIEPTPAV